MLMSTRGEDSVPDTELLRRFDLPGPRYTSPRANMTCATYPREISEQRGRYEDQPGVEGSDARTEEFFRSGRNGRSP